MMLNAMSTRPPIASVPLTQRHHQSDVTCSTSPLSIPTGSSPTPEATVSPSSPTPSTSSPSSLSRATTATSSPSLDRKQNFDQKSTPNKSSEVGTAQSQPHNNNNNNTNKNSELKTMAETSTMITTTKPTTSTKMDVATTTTAQEIVSMSAISKNQNNSNKLAPTVKHQQKTETNLQDNPAHSTRAATTNTSAISPNMSHTFHHNNNIVGSHSQKSKFNTPSASSHQSNSNHSSNSLGHNSRSSNLQRSHINSSHIDPKHSNHYHHHHHGNHNNSYHHHHNHGQHHQSFGTINSVTSDEHQHSRHHHGQHLQNQQQNSPHATFNQAASSTLITSDVGNNNSLTNFGPPHYVDLHVNTGECISLQSLDGQEQVFTGPATITMISQQQSPPVPIPVQVPPGHMVHQIADENGTLKHIILSVMVDDENSQLNSTVINLPHGSFRINSLGELVGVEVDLVGDRDSANQLQDQASSIAQPTSSTNSSTAPTIHHLPQQQTYFANYDGCPVINYDTTLGAYSTHYNGQPPYNNMVSNSYHHESTSPSSYKTSPSLLPHQAPPVIPMASGPAPYPFAYSNFNNQIQSHQPSMASVVSSAVGKQSSNHHKNALTSNGHQANGTYVKVTDNENHLPRNNNRIDSQPATQNNMNTNLTSIISNSRVQRNDINSQRQQNAAINPEESNKYNQRTLTGNPVNHLNNSINSGSSHSYQNNSRSSNSSHVGLAANPRLSKMRGSHQHHHQSPSVPSYGMRNNYNYNNHGDSMHDSGLLSSDQAIKDSKHINSFTSPHSPNLSLTHQKNQQVNNQRSFDLAKTGSSNNLSGDLSPVVDSSAVGKKRDSRTSSAKENQNSKQKPEIEIDTKEIAKCGENGSPIPSRNSRGKYKKILRETAKQSNQKRQQSIDDPSVLPTDYLRSRSVNENASKSVAIDSKIKTKSQDKKNVTQQDSSIVQTQSNKGLTNTDSNSCTETAQIHLEAGNVDSEIVSTDNPPAVTVMNEASTEATAGVGLEHPKNLNMVRISEENNSVARDEIDGIDFGKFKSKQTDALNKSISSSGSSHKGDSPARKKSKSSQGSPKLTTSSSNETVGVKDEKYQDTKDLVFPSEKSEDILTVSKSTIDHPEGTHNNDSTNNQLNVVLSMHTSRSENDIQLLKGFSVGRFQNQVLKQPPPQPSTSIDNVDVDNQATANVNEQVISRKSESKRKSSNGKSEQQFKLNSLPQVRLLNLNCVSVTSSTVCLRWSYIPSLADKHGIHHHHHGSKHHAALYDHFVVESSSLKNSDTNTLINPKIVYQGCAMTCRINQLVAEKIYHFRIRRTALVSSADGEKLAVSEILSVTLPSAQQANSSKRSQNAIGKLSNSASDNQSSTASGDSAAQMNLTLAGSQGLVNRCNTSSHNISNLQQQQQQQQHHNIKASSSHHHHHNHPIKFSNIVKQCRNKFVTMCGTMVRNSLSSCSDTNFAGFLLILFTIVAMLLAMIIHLYIVAPVYE